MADRSYYLTSIIVPLLTMQPAADQPYRQFSCIEHRLDTLTGSQVAPQAHLF